MLGLPRNDNEEVQAVPCVSQVAFLPENPQCNHLDDHFHSKEGKDEIVKALQRKGKVEGCSCIAAHSHQGRELETRVQQGLLLHHQELKSVGRGSAESSPVFFHNPDWPTAPAVLR